MYARRHPIRDGLPLGGPIEVDNHKRAAWYDMLQKALELTGTSDAYINQRDAQILVNGLYFFR